MILSARNFQVIKSALTYLKFSLIAAAQSVITGVDGNKRPLIVFLSSMLDAFILLIKFLTKLLPQKESRKTGKEQRF